MAYAKIHAIKATVGKAIEYITNPLKTILPNGTELVSSYKCASPTAHLEFKQTAELAKRLKGDYTKTGRADIQAYHIVQSFPVTDKVTGEQVHELGKAFAGEMLKGKYEYVLATHIDKGHIHNHIIFNATSFEDLKKYQSKPYKTVAQIRAISDKICKENNLSVIKKNTKSKSEHYVNWLLNKENKLSWREGIIVIQQTIDTVLPKVESFAEFESELNNNGIKLKNGKHIAFCLEGQDKYVRGKYIGDKYTMESLEKRLGVSDESRKADKINIIIDKKYIHTIADTGFFVSVPEQDGLLYLNNSKAYLVDNALTVSLAPGEDNLLFNKSFEKVGTLNDVATQHILKEMVYVPEVNEQGEVSIADQIRLNAYKRKALLHKTAEAVKLCRGEGVIYYSDFNVRLSELQNMVTETQAHISSVKDRLDSFNTICKNLMTVEQYRELEAERDSKWTERSRKKFEQAHKEEFELLFFAKENLAFYGFDPQKYSSSDITVVIAPTRKQLSELEYQCKSIERRIKDLKKSKDTIDTFTSPEKRQQEPNLSVNKKISRDIDIGDR